MKVLHIGKYYHPFFGGIEAYLKALVESPSYQVDSYVLVHQEQIGLESQSHVINNIKVRKVKTVANLLYTPIAPSILRELNNAIATFSPDVIHIHMPNPSAFACLLSCKAKSIPWVVHWHADVVGQVPDFKIKIAYYGYRIFEKMILKRANAVIATSPNYSLSSIPLKKFQDKTFVVPLGIKDIPYPSTKENPDESQLKLLIVGRLTYYKGHELLIKAIAGLANPSLISLTIIGEGELKGKLQNIVTETGLSDQVCFVGQVDNEQLFQSIAECDLLCLPSIERTEAFGIVLIEAGRFAKPVLATRVEGSGMAYVVKDGQTGILVEPNSISAIQHSLTAILNGEYSLNQLGRNARMRFTQKFNIECSAKSICTMYENL